MAITDTKHIVIRKVDDVPVALEELQDGDGIHPSYVEYVSTGNTTITATKLDQALDQIEVAFDAKENYVAPVTPYFSAYQTLPTLTTNGYTKIIFDTVAQDNASGFDTVLGEYEIPTGGMWKFNATIKREIQSHFIKYWFSMYLFVNGVMSRLMGTCDIHNQYNQPQDLIMLGTGQCSVNLSAGDKVSIVHERVHIDPAQDSNTIVGATNTRFTGHLQP